MSRRAQLAALLLTALAATACGKSATTPTRVKMPTAVEAKAAASAINLTAADLPGYTRAPADNSSSKEEKQAEHKFALCVGASSFGDTAAEITDATSDDFSKGTEPNSITLSSDVTVIKSASQAASELKAFQGSKAVGCFKTFVESAFKAGAGDVPGLTVGPIDVQQLTPPSTGTSGSFGYTVTSSLSAQGMTFPVSMAIEAALKDHTELSFTAFSLGSESISGADRDAVWLKLLARLVASAV